MSNRAKKSPNYRRLLVLGLAAAMTAPGCASMKSPTSWFARNTTPTQTSKSGVVATLGNTSKGIAGQFKSMGTAVTSAVGKAKSAVTSTFTSTETSGDATSLANMPANLEAEVWVANGQLFESQGNMGKALENYTSALDKEPGNEAALLSTARLYARQEKSSEAEVFFQKAIAANPTAASTFNELALVQQQLGKTSEAQAAIGRAITLAPANPRYRNNLAGMLVAVGQSDQAVSQLQQVFPPAVANYNVAFLHFSNNNLAGAQQHLEIALKEDPNLKQARDLLNRVGGSGSGQSAIAAMGTANQIYRTAQALGTPTQAGPAIYQRPATSGLPVRQASVPVRPGTFSPAAQQAAANAQVQLPSFSQTGTATTSLPPLPANRGYSATGAGMPAASQTPVSQVGIPAASYPATGYPALPASQNRYSQ